MIKTCVLATGLLLVLPSSVVMADGLQSVDNEIFDFGLSAGVINIEDFGSEITLGTNATFKATQDIFLQFNYFQASVDLSSYERSQGQFFGGSDRDYIHYDLLVGVNILQAEFALPNGEPNIGSFYVVGGVGDTEFGGEERFTYTYGAGYQVAFDRDYIVRLDYRGYAFDSSLSDRERRVYNGGLSLGFSYQF